MADLALAEKFKVNYSAALHRKTLVTYKYNCHGLTFAARRTFISSSVEIRKILTEDGYVKVDNIAEVLAGDVAIYIGADGDIEHSGIVIDNPLDELMRNPKILSKWGSAHEVIHRAFDSPYSKNVQYYRMLS